MLHQRDTYFHAVQGRLKLREAGGGPAELISYRRADRGGPKVSNYRVVQVMDPAGVGEALADALGVRAVVEKARRLLLWRGARVHLDTVAGLGHFVELEAVSEARAACTPRRRRSPSCARRSRSPTTCWWRAGTGTCWSGRASPAEAPACPRTPQKKR